jgi:hypothetical protein
MLVNQLNTLYNAKEAIQRVVYNCSDAIVDSIEFEDGSNTKFNFTTSFPVSLDHFQTDKKTNHFIIIHNLIVDNEENEPEHTYPE